MSIDSIECADTNQSNFYEADSLNVSQWNGRHVTFSCDEQILIVELIQTTFKGDPNVRCCSGSASISAEVNIDGSTEVSAEVEISNDSGNVSFGVEGNVSHDSSGETNGGVSAEFTVKW